MARNKATRSGVVTGHSTGGHYTAEGEYVILHGVITDAEDAGRPVVLKMSEADARRWAAGLVKMADLVARHKAAKGDDRG